MLLIHRRAITDIHLKHVQLSTMGERGVSRLVSVLLSSASLSLSLLLLSLSKHTCRFPPPCSLETQAHRGKEDQESALLHIPQKSESGHSLHFGHQPERAAITDNISNNLLGEE